MNIRFTENKERSSSLILLTHLEGELERFNRYVSKMDNGGWSLLENDSIHHVEFDDGDEKITMWIVPVADRDEYDFFLHCWEEAKKTDR